MADKIYIRQWGEVEGILFAEIGFELDKNKIEDDELEDIELSVIPIS